MIPEQGNQEGILSYSNHSNVNCEKCGKPYIYVGDVPQGGFPIGQEPYCTCYANVKVINDNKWQYCPHCGKELR